MMSMHQQLPPEPAIGITARLRRLLAILAAVAILAAAAGIWMRGRGNADLAQWTAEQAIPSVATFHPKPSSAGGDLILPGDVQAYFEAPIHARVSGYLKDWKQDIGAHVKSGQLLAEIDTPDLDQQLSQAEADLAQARANAELAELTAKRWKALLTTDAVSQQETDEKLGTAAARKAAAEAAAANVSRLQTMEQFKRITAPFDGVVTARKTDVGALINAGGGSGPELFSVADVHKLRVYVQVPQNLSSGIHGGVSAELALPQHPGRHFAATVTTTSEAIAMASRTMLVELETESAQGALAPGDYAEVHFHLAGGAQSVRVPASALMFRAEGLQVATLGPEDKVVMKPVTIARDLGNEAEIAQGVTAADLVIDSPPDSLSAGDKVRPLVVQ